MTKDEQLCVAHFEKTTTRKEDGRFVVELPFRNDGPSLGYSKSNALRRFYNLERKLLKDKSLHDRYSAFVQEFIDLGHLEKVPEGEMDNPRNFYLPHHCVFKEDSTTTKLRVVFDASAKTTSGYSLNECLLTGPKLQDDLFNFLIRFIFFKVALSADVHYKVSLCKIE